MKKGIMFNMIPLSVVLLTTINADAQDTTTAGQDLKVAANKTGHAVKKSAKKVVNKTAELASKSKAGVVDKIYDGKAGPNGETIYINNKSKYYYIDKKGHRQFLPESQLKDKGK